MEKNVNYYDGNMPFPESPRYKNIHFYIAEVTPDRAKFVLENHNNLNRSFSKERIRSYTTQMLASQWDEMNGEPLIFSGKGNLLDGQHRLMAIVKSGLSFDFVTVTGIDEEKFRSIDQGKVRSFGDILKIKGVKNNLAIAAICGKVLALERRIIRNTKTGKLRTQSSGLEKPNLEQEEEDNRGLYQDAYKFASALYEKYRSLMAKSDIGGYYAYLIKNRSYGKDRVAFFFEELYSDYRSQYSSIRLLRERLSRNANGTETIRAKTRHYLIVKAWNAYILHKEVKTLRWIEELEGDIDFI